LIKLSITAKLGIGAALLVIISSSIVGSLFYYKTTELLVEHSAQEIATKIGIAGSRLQANIDAQKSDVLALSNTPPIQGMIRAKKNNGYDLQENSSYQQWRTRLESIFAVTLKSKPTYLTIRFIDKNGQEKVVVRNAGNDIYPLPDNALQNKRHSIFFQQTMTLSKEEVYLSEINLNREHGKISIPHQQVLRSATPIYDKQTKRIAGLVIITAEIGHAFYDIQKHYQSNTAKMYITNDHGGYLLHPDHSKTYGFDLGKRYRIQEDIPQLAPMYLPENKESEFTLIPKNSTDEFVLNFTKIPIDNNHPERFIAVGITQPYESIVEQQSHTLNDVVIMASALSAGFILLAIFFSYQISRPIKQMAHVMANYGQYNKKQKKASLPIPNDRHDEIGLLAKSYEKLINQIEDGQKDLESLNKNLSSMVAERTLKLESSEKLQRSILESMADGLITSDKNGTILSINSAAEKIFGYKQAEVLGKNLSVFMPPTIGVKHNSFLLNYRKNALQKSVNTHLETEAQRKDGSVFPVDLAITAVQINDKQMFVGIVRDITERKAIDKMKSEFISTVSHELRTPLTAIRGALGLVNGGALGEISEKISEILILAGNNTDRLLLIINDILDLQKIEAGEMSFTFSKLSVRALLQQSIDENKTYGEQFKVRFVLKEVEDITINADHGRMLQVLANLLSNAAKFSPENGVVELGAHKKSDGSSVITVTDYGEGIPEEFQPKLFDKFTQSDSANTRKTGSTGLGLSITKNIIEAHGWHIDFVSQEGQGTTFTIHIPDTSA